MGVFLQTGETHNKKPVWSRHEGPFKLYYSNGIVHIYCDDNDSNITDNDFTVGYWKIGRWFDDEPSDDGVLKTADLAGDLWPHQIRSWQYYTFTLAPWASDPKLTVTGNMNTNTYSLL